ncbi:MAG TPA: EAL domain-containing protein [Thermoanaerobaculia bacterium]|nr:EAL domain-containing protein [Thermoanaerobaculia bacterium]
MPDGVGHRDLFESSALPMWIHDPATGRFLAVNDAAITSYQWSRDELLDRTIDLLTPSSTDRQALDRVTPSSLVDGGEHRRKDGSALHVEVNVQETDYGGRPARLVVAIDVTDRKLAEELLLKSERQLADAQEIAHVGSFEWEIESDVVRWSDELFRIYGLKPREFKATYAAFLERIHPEDRKAVEDTIRRTVETGNPFQMEERIVRPDGVIRTLESRGQLIPGQRRLVGVCRDVTELREAEKERAILSERERDARRTAEAAHARVSEILERITDAFIALDRHWHYIYVNEKAAQIFGRDRDSLIGRHIWTEFPEGVGQPFHLAYEKAMATQQSVQIEEYYPPWDRWFENRIYPSPNGLAVYFQDVTERRRKEDQLREMSDRLARTEAFSLVMATMVTMDGFFSKVPPTLCKLLGYTEEELLSMHVEELIHPDDLEDDRVHRQRIIRGEVQSLDIELRLMRKDAGIVWVYLNCSGVYDADSRQTHFIVYLRDITERHHAEERIRHQALHDGLTDLPNRVLFNDRLEQAIAHAHRHDARLAVIAVDLDDFKFVNDNFGHSVGDVVIREVAARMKTALRTTDTIARLGGDEFVIIVEDVDDDQQAHAIAGKVRELFQDRIDVGSSSVRVTSCSGISIFPRDGHDSGMLLRSAEIALNRAKEIGHDHIQLFDESMSAPFRDRLKIEQELHQAIENAQLLSYYQPILRTRDRKIVAVEALIRWNHPQRGIIGPDAFIPLAEETRLIVPIGDFVLRSACRDVQRWIDRGFDLRLSVNLSVRQFQELTLLHKIDSILAETSFDPSRLEFEVTESVAMQNADFTMALLRDLRQRNISIAIDDFGVGQTSLIHLRQFPINTIKIDKVFINDVLTDVTDAAIVSAVISLAHALGLCATAEGVESEEQMHMLQTFGCDLLQGYYFSRPVPPEQMEALLTLN